MTLVAVVLSLSSETAGAKVLPVTSVEVVTRQPIAGAPIQVVVRFGENFDLPDAPWENFEISVVSADRADANGWPLDRNDRGMLVSLRRTSKTVFHGSFVVGRAGDYIVFSWSGVYAREDQLRGAVTAGAYAAPVRFRVGGIASPAQGAVRSTVPQRSSTLLVGLAVSVTLLVIGASLALVSTWGRS